MAIQNNSQPAVPANTAPTGTAPAQAQPSAQPSAPAGGDATQQSGSENKSTVSHDWITDDVRKAMEFDPFTPESDEVKTNSAQGTGSPSVEGGTAQPAQPTSDPTQPSQPSGAPTTQPVDVNTFATELLNAVKAGTAPAQPAKSETSETAQDPWEVVPDYTYTLPPQLAAAMSSEDPGERQKATLALMQGVSATVHQQVVKQVGTIVKNMQQALPNLINQTMQAERFRQSVAQDFYGKYPKLNVPQLYPIVAKISAEVMKEKKINSWTAELRDETARRVVAMIQQITGTVVDLGGANANPNPAPQVPQNQPVMFNGSGAPRVENASGSKTQVDHMADIFN